MKEELKAKVKALQVGIAELEKQIEEFDSAPEQNIFDSLEDAEGRITDRFSDIAHEQCEGAGNCGQPEFKQKFSVSGKFYEAKVSFEYNRHDKTYYYIDGTDYSHVAL